MIVVTRTMRTLAPRVRALLLSAAVGLASACGGSGGDLTPASPTQPTQPAAPAPVPGTLTARLVTPNADDGAILLDISGPAPIADITTVVQGAVVHSRTNGNATRVAVFGSLASGALIRFSVPDVNAAAQFTAQVTEVSDRASALRPVTGYGISVEP